jgi:phosphomethylpyrimidine synthase
MTAAQKPSTTGAASTRKTYVQRTRPDVRAPMREVMLSTGDSVVLYNTSGLA